MIRPSRAFAVWSGVLALAVGCAGTGSLPDPEAVQQRVALTSFSGENACRDLEAYIEDTAVLQMRSQLEQAKTNTWERYAEAGNARPSAAGAADSAGKSSAPSSYTTTNTQVAGVDEADFVKNDGTRIFVLSGDTLYTTTSWPATALALVGRLKIEGWPREMFLDEKNRLVVFSTIWSPRPFSPADARPAMDAAYFGGNTTKTTLVDVSDLAKPTVTREVYSPGSYSSSRRVGSSVRLVLSDQFNYPPEVSWYPQDADWRFWEDDAYRARQYDQLIAKNEKLIREQSLEKWLNPSFVRQADGSLKELPLDCTRYYRTNAPTELGLVTVTTMNLDADLLQGGLAQTSVVGQAGEVYASESALYVANPHWWWWPRPGQQDATYLHEFDITSPGDAVYVGSGVVPGHIVNQFSMDEYKGNFRVATTVSQRVRDTENPQNVWGRMETTNKLFVLGNQDGSLKVIGESEELAKGERIFSARFIGDRGFVVTFRQVDPLFTFDLSDPTKPQKVGELKVPGFSTYLHPIDADHLLAIGTYVPENNTDWRARALQLAIFDVSDMANPKQTFVKTVGTSYAWSEAQYDHKAFNYFPAKKLLAIPFYDYRQGAYGDDYWSWFVSDLRVFSIDAATGIEPRGALSMSDVYRSFSYMDWAYYWMPFVRRSVMADDFVYAISDAGIRVANVAALDAPIATVKFDHATP